MALDSVHRQGLDADEDEDQDFKPLTMHEAKALREREPALSPWWVVGLQCAAGVAAVLVFARGLMSQFSSLNAATASFGFFVWEAVKLGVSVAMVVLAPHLVAELNWLALMAGLFVTLKMYWLALLKRPKPKQI